MLVKFLQSILVFPLAIASLACHGQEDKNVKTKDVPAAVKDYISRNYPGAAKLKYYKEIEKDTTFYEAVFTYKNDQYALLLFPDGREHETEIVIKHEELPAAVKEKIGQDLAKRFTRYTIVLTEEVNPHRALKYEIEVRARKGNKHGYYELLYDDKGNFMEEEEETLKSIPSNSGF